MDSEIKKIYDLMYSPLVTPYNLLSNAKLPNYEYVNYYQGADGLIAEMKCKNTEGNSNVYFYHFDEKDFLKEIFILNDNEKDLIYSRKCELEKKKLDYKKQTTACFKETAI